MTAEHQAGADRGRHGEEESRPGQGRAAERGHVHNGAAAPVGVIVAPGQRLEDDDRQDGGVGQQQRQRGVVVHAAPAQIPPQAAASAEADAGQVTEELVGQRRRAWLAMLRDVQPVAVDQVAGGQVVLEQLRGAGHALRGQARIYDDARVGRAGLGGRRRHEARVGPLRPVAAHFVSLGLDLVDVAVPGRCAGQSHGQVGLPRSTAVMETVPVIDKDQILRRGQDDLVPVAVRQIGEKLLVAHRVGLLGHRGRRPPLVVV